MNGDSNQYHALVDRLLKFEHDNGPSWQYVTLGPAFSLDIPQIGSFLLTKWVNLDEFPDRIVLDVLDTHMKIKVKIRAEIGDPLFIKMDQLYSKAIKQGNIPEKLYLETLVTLLDDYSPNNV